MHSATGRFNLSNVRSFFLQIIEVQVFPLSVQGVLQELYQLLFLFNDAGSIHILFATFQQSSCPRYQVLGPPYRLFYGQISIARRHYINTMNVLVIINNLLLSICSM